MMAAWELGSQVKFGGKHRVDHATRSITLSMQTHNSLAPYPSVVGLRLSAARQTYNSRQLNREGRTIHKAHLLYHGSSPG